MKVYAVKGHRLNASERHHRFARMSGEVWFRDHHDAERYAEDLAIFCNDHVEVQHLNVTINNAHWLNIPGEHRFETRISRLDVYFIDERSQCLTRRTCNIF